MKLINNATPIKTRIRGFHSRLYVILECTIFWFTSPPNNSPIPKTIPEQNEKMYFKSPTHVLSLVKMKNKNGTTRLNVMKLSPDMFLGKDEGNELPSSGEIFSANFHSFV